MTSTNYQTVCGHMGVDEFKNRNENLGPFSFKDPNQKNRTVPINRQARYIRIYIDTNDAKTPGSGSLSLAEVQVFGTPIQTTRTRTR